MKRIAIILLTLLLSALLFVSCADEEKTPESTTNNEVALNNELPYQYDLTPYVEVEQSDYEGIEVTRVDATVTDDDLNDAIASVLDENAELVEVTGTPAKFGDTANIDFKGYVDGVAFEGGEGVGYDLVLGSGAFIDGFEEAIVGHMAGEDFTIDVTFPEGYNEELGGKDAKFEITLNSLKSSVYPEFNEEFIKVISEYETIEEYLTGLTELLTEEKAYEAETQMKQEAYSAIYENVKILDYPKEEYDFYYNDFVSYYENVSQSEYGVDLDTYITDVAQSTREEFEYYADANAKMYIEQELIIFAIANQVGLIDELTDEEYNAYLAELAENNGLDSAVFESYYGKREIWKAFVTEKTLDYVLEKAVISEPETETEE